MQKNTIAKDTQNWYALVIYNIEQKSGEDKTTGLQHCVTSSVKQLKKKKSITAADNSHCRYLCYLTWP